jgi:molybdopterin synthase sulfur carrier subunit
MQQNERGEGNMIRIRFFARFREIFGAEIVREPEEGTSVARLIRSVAGDNQEGQDALFDAEGELRRYVILMRNGKRIENTRAADILVSDGDEIAVFPPVAGG